MSLILQRKLLGDASRWRTVCRFKPKDLDKIEKAVETISELDDVQWRIVTDDDTQRALVYHDGRCWKP